MSAEAAKKQEEDERKFWRMWRTPALFDAIHAFNRGWRGEFAVFAIINNNMHTMKHHTTLAYLGCEHVLALYLGRFEIYAHLDACVPFRFTSPINCPRNDLRESDYIARTSCNGVPQAMPVYDGINCVLQMWFMHHVFSRKKYVEEPETVDFWKYLHMFSSLLSNFQHPIEINKDFVVSSWQHAPPTHEAENPIGKKRLSGKTAGILRFVRQRSLYAESRAKTCISIIICTSIREKKLVVERIEKEFRDHTSFSLYFMQEGIVHVYKGLTYIIVVLRGHERIDEHSLTRGLVANQVRELKWIIQQDFECTTFYYDEIVYLKQTFTHFVDEFPACAHIGVGTRNKEYRETFTMSSVAWEEPPPMQVANIVPHGTNANQDGGSGAWNI